jgi:hypothetical protein
MQTVALETSIRDGDILTYFNVKVTHKAVIGTDPQNILTNIETLQYCQVYE